MRRQEKLFGQTLPTARLPRRVRSYGAMRGKPLQERVAVVTCVAGLYDEIVSPWAIDEGFEYYLFADRAIQPRAPYTVRACNHVDPDPRRTARFVKTHLHNYFADHDLVVWLDGNLAIIKSLRPFIEAMRGAEPLGFIPHPTRSNYLDEMEECRGLRLDDVDIIEEQINRYHGNKSLARSRLIETNFFIARPRDQLVRTFINLWWNEINLYSVRDQFSVNYAITKAMVPHRWLMADGYSARDHGAFMMFEHAIQERDELIEQFAPSQRGLVDAA